MAAILHALLASASVAGRTCVGLVFLLAATQKVLHWRILPGVIANYRLLPQWMVLPATALLPPVELILAGLLLSAQFQLWASVAAMLVLLLFAAAMAVNIRRGREHIDCGCGESFLRQPLNGTLMVRNGLLAALLIPSLAATGRVDVPLTLSAVAAGLGLFLLYVLLNILAALPPAERRSHHFA